MGSAVWYINCEVHTGQCVVSIAYNGLYRFRITKSVSALFKKALNGFMRVNILAAKLINDSC